MKKVILVLLLFLCGCSNTLTCSYKTEYEDIKIKNKIVFNFDEDTLIQVDKMIFNDSVSASNYYKEIEQYKDQYNLRLEKNVITSEIVDQIKIDGDEKSIKQKYESYEYKCK